ncbi:MAG: phosphoribosylformylglycinamidine cyclo-ligase [Deltaproteobacteria bacterium]|jgi:phosphoribosylformylglycinamidine cyclo-ligase|nr:phosphoribosylformylglycinamidine cyclo-ligase [Deltaproteobacteria bacterium]
MGLNDGDSLTYRDSGVDIDAGQEAVRRLAPLARSTFDTRVLNDIGGFSGLYGLGSLQLDDPVLVSSTDGVGTKLKVAIMADRHDTVGQDLVAMSVNDILTQGARPLFFLDYLATSKIAPEKVEIIVGGIAAGCRLAGCALLGGETAEMPDFYQGSDYDLAGFAVGVVERSKIIDGSLIGLSHKIIGLSSSGLHSNGYSLARKIIFDRMGLTIDSPFLGETVADILLKPTKIYVSPVLSALRRQEVHGIVHITGGGILDNLPRVLPHSCRAAINLKAWEKPPIFDLLREEGKLDTLELYRTFNMGLGLLLIVPENEVDPVMAIMEDHRETAQVVGFIEPREGEERVRFFSAEAL